MSLKGNAIANYLGQGWTILMGFAFIPVYIRFLGLEAYGLIGVFALLQAWLSLLDVGLTVAIGREMALFRGGGHDAHWISDLLRSVEIAGLGVALLVASGIWAASGWLASGWLHVETLPVGAVADAFRIMGVVAAMRVVENIYRGSMVGLQRQITLNVVSSAMATLRAVGAVAILARVSPSIEAFFLWQGLVSTVTIAVFASLVRGSLPPIDRRPRFSLATLQGVSRFATGTVLVTLLGFLLSQSDKLILSSLLSLEPFALYSLAYTVASAVRQLAQPIDQAVYPGMTQLYQQGDEAGLASLYHRSTQYSVVLMGGVGVFLAVFGEQVLALWTQDRTMAREVYAVLWILVLGMVLNGIMNRPYYLQMAAGWTGLLVRGNLVLVLVFTPAIYVLTKQYEMTGAAVAWGLLNFVYVVIVVRLMHQRLLMHELRDWYTKDLLLPLCAAGAAAFAVKLLAPAPQGRLPTFVLLTLALAGTVLTAALAAGVVRGALGAHLKMVLGRST